MANASAVVQWQWWNMQCNLLHMEDTKDPQEYIFCAEHHPAVFCASSPIRTRDDLPEGSCRVPFRRRRVESGRLSSSILTLMRVTRLGPYSRDREDWQMPSSAVRDVSQPAALIVSSMISRISTVPCMLLAAGRPPSWICCALINNYLPLTSELGCSHASPPELDGQDHTFILHVQKVCI